MKHLISLSLCLLAPLVTGQVLFNPKNVAASSSNAANPSVPIDITSLFNNRAFAMQPGDADFDGKGSGYPAEFLPPPTFVYSGINYTFPQYSSSGNDNALAIGQTVEVPKGRYLSVQMLGAGETGSAEGFINATYSDGSTSSGPVLVPAWWTFPYASGGDIILPHYLTKEGVDYNRSMIFQTINWLDSTKELVSLTLPNVTAGKDSLPGGVPIETRLHLFSLSLLPATGSGIELDVQYARTTNLWIPDTDKTQIVEVIINNVGSDWILANNSVKVEISAPGLKTVVPGYIKRLQPGDQAKIQVGVVNAEGVKPGTTGEATVKVTGSGVDASYGFAATYGIKQYEATYESIYEHESPSWYSDAKYGIFIHWGVYSVPGWGNVGPNETYAEWYWYRMNLGPGNSDQIYEYNLATYGPNHTYDEFIQDFTADAFDPKEWVDLFDDAGAKYFVQVSKHHDGYALFDMPDSISKRTSVALFPYRNLLQELFDAAKEFQPQMHRATYFSLPEWFHPDYKELGFSLWPGGNASNPYTKEVLPYEGYVPVENFVSDLIVPQMEILADMGTEIMWCDIGGPNMTVEFAAAWFNAQAEMGNQVLLDDRCGVPGDFSTPEYARYDAVQVRKWESNLGMDPFSYGYNRATPDEAYMTAPTIVTSLVDIVSKNGNFLLDIGPQANGTILDIQQRHLRDAGKWIKEHDEAIFNTTYWFVTPEENVAGGQVRFTQTLDAFYILTLEEPGSSFTLESPVPWVPSDKVTIVGGSMSGTVVPAKKENGRLILDVSDEMKKADQYAWVFKIDFGS